MKQLVRGDRVEVEWYDIYTDPTAEPGAAHLYKQKQIGYYWGPTASESIPCLVLTQYSNDESSQDGFTCIPEALVASVRKLRKPAKKDTK